MHRFTLPALLLSALLTAACSAGAPGQPTAGSRNLLTAEEIEQIEATTVLEAIERLRPTFLRPRGAVSTSAVSGLPIIYIDDVRAGGVERLRDLPASQVQEIRYLRPRDATTRFGSGHGYGAILVATRR